MLDQVYRLFQQYDQLLEKQYPVKIQTQLVLKPDYSGWVQVETKKDWQSVAQFDSLAAAIAELQNLIDAMKTFANQLEEQKRALIAEIARGTPDIIVSSPIEFLKAVGVAETEIVGEWDNEVDPDGYHDLILDLTGAHCQVFGDGVIMLDDAERKLLTFPFSLVEFRATLAEINSTN